MLVRSLKVIVHTALFLTAIIVFFLGLGIGLQYNPQLGTALWIGAGILVVLNLVWILRRKRTPSQ